MAFFSRPQSASAAVKIVNPNSPAVQEDESKGPARKDSVQRQCRNIVIYGSCKYQDKGCIYYHPPAQEAVQPTASTPSSSLSTSITAEAVNAPVFVPKSATTVLDGRSSPAVISDSPVPSFSLPQSISHPLHAESHQDSSLSQPNPYDASMYPGTEQQLDSQYYGDPQYNGYGQEYMHNGDMSYYQPTPTVYTAEPLNYHLYSAAIPSTFLTSSTDTHFVPPSNELRQTLQAQSEASHAVPLAASNLPEELQGYHTLMPLDEASPTERRKTLNWHSSLYKATNSNDGACYALRRIENFRLMNPAAFGPIEQWVQIRHPSLVSVREAFTTRAFGDNSLVVVYGFHPKSRTLFDLYIKSSPPTLQQSFNQRSQILVQNQATAIPLRTLWSYIVQISMAIKKAHENGMAVRTIDSTKIIVTGKNRIRIGSCGLMDVLTFDSRPDISALQLEDLTHFGRLIFALCCNNLTAAVGPNFQKSLDHIHRTYGTEIKTLALFLISKPTPHKTVQSLFEMILPHLCNEVDDTLIAADRLENELLSELENARLVRLLCKFGFINERPEFARDLRWSETGDRYIIKLFRDYVFHQVDEHGKPVTDLSHVLTCLNKLDAGTEEKIMLVSRDEQSCLVVSYAEIKNCVDSAFRELAQTTASQNAHTYR